MPVVTTLVCAALLIAGTTLWLLSARCATRILAAAADPNLPFMFEFRRRFWLRGGVAGTKRLIRLFASALGIIGVALAISAAFGHAHF
jgi:hypothetical protein